MDIAVSTHFQGSTRSGVSGGDEQTPATQLSCGIIRRELIRRSAHAERSTHRVALLVRMAGRIDDPSTLADQPSWITIELG
jgi:hypothetical protein